VTIISDKDPFEASINFINCAFEVSNDDTMDEAAICCCCCCCFSSILFAVTTVAVLLLLLLLLSVAVVGEDGNGVDGNCGGDADNSGGNLARSEICDINEVSKIFDDGGGADGTVILVDISSCLLLLLLTINIGFDAI